MHTQYTEERLSNEKGCGINVITTNKSGLTTALDSASTRASHIHRIYLFMYFRLYSNNKQTQSLLNMDYITNELEPWSTNDMKCVCPEMFNVRYPMCSANEDQTCVTDYLGYEPKPGDSIQFKRRDTRSTKQRDTEDVKERIDKVRTRRAEAFASGLRVKVT